VANGRMYPVVNLTMWRWNHKARFLLATYSRTKCPYRHLVYSCSLRYFLQSLAGLPSSGLSCDLTQSCTQPKNLWTSLRVFLACKHTRTRSCPFGTVGWVIGRTTNPRDCRCADSGRACGVKSGIIGVGSDAVVDGAVKCASRRTRLGGNE